MTRRLLPPLLAVVTALSGAAMAQTSPTPGLPDPVFDNPVPPPPKPYQMPVQPAPFVPPTAAPMYQPAFPGPRTLAVPTGPARPIMGTVCVVPAAKSRPVIRCDSARVIVGTACRCGDSRAGDGASRAGRVRVR